jgi:acetyl-CoA acetyltransferase family protein
MPSSENRQAYIAHAVRTPFGSNFGSLSATRPDDLLGFTIKSLVDDLPQLDRKKIDDVVMGDSNGSGEDNRNVARMGALLAGLPDTVPGVTLNRLCGSGGEAIIQSSRAVRTGDAEFVIAGGVEVMSRAPWIYPRDSKKPPQSVDLSQLQQSTVGWRFINPAFPKHWTQSLGRCSEIVAERLGISRSEQDEWALRSHLLAAEAWDQKLHTDYVKPYEGLHSDESIRRDTSLEKLSALPSAFSEGGAGTAGNSSPINDGSVAMLVTSQIGLKELGLSPVAEILGAQVTATSPDEFSLAPVSAIDKLLKKMDVEYSEIKVWEINEAFASMVLTVLHESPKIDRSKVNVHGGAIALGHPVGASAARVVVDCARELRRQGGGIGIAAACIGVGLGIAIALKVE